MKTNLNPIIDVNSAVISNLADALVMRNKFGNNFKITADYIGVDGVVQWSNLMTMLNKTAWEYMRFVENTAFVASGETSVKKYSDDVHFVVSAIINAIGPVNGYHVRENNVIFLKAISVFEKSKEVFHGEALTVKSEKDNVSKELRNVKTGMNPDYVASLEAQKEELSKRLNELRKIPGMVTTEPVPVSDETFRKAFERELARVVAGQNRKSADELKAEDDARKAEKKAQRKANKAKK